MKAGVDIGSTLTKVAWDFRNGRYQLASTADWDTDVLMNVLKEDGVNEVCLTGNGKPRIDWQAEGFRVVKAPGDRLTHEFRMQAEGTRRILASNGDETKNFLLVSVGTGTSYTFVSENGVETFPLGTAVGGGYIVGASNPLHDVAEIDRLSREGTVQDLRMQDVAPSAESLPGWVAVAHFGKLRDLRISAERSYDHHADEYASRMHMTAFLILRDIMLLRMLRREAVGDLVVFIGSTVMTFGVMRDTIGKYTEALQPAGLLPRTLVLPYGEYAGAVGAYHAVAG